MRALIYFLTKKTLEIFNKSSPNKPNAVFIQYQCHYFLTDYPREGVPTRESPSNQKYMAMITINVVNCEYYLIS